MKRFGLFLLVAAILFARYCPAAAQCVGHEQNSLTGSWIIYVSYSSTSGLSWTRIPLVISTTGAVQAGTTTVDAFRNISTVTGGSLILNTLNCTVTGKILIKPAGSLVTSKIVIKNANLSLDNQTIVGSGLIAGAPFTFTGVKVNTL